ncbi:hypothetical protein DFH09DRAFT_1097436 [Mycena vulgaris]|nr:hypothetical protein DFH09DRAFT_1097436 [Mycena vulgaris]
MFADRLELDFAPNDDCPLFRGYRKSHRFLRDTVAEYSENPPHITLMLGAFYDPRGELLQTIGDLCAQQPPLEFDLILEYKPKVGVWAAVDDGEDEMRALRADVMAELCADEYSQRPTWASGVHWSPHVTLYRRDHGERSSLKVKQEIARDLAMQFQGPLVGYATGASLWLGDEWVDSFPFLGEREDSEVIGRQESEWE